MAPKIPEKQLQQQHNQREQSKQQPLNNNSIAIKHSNPFHISANTLCHNKRLKLKRSKYSDYLRNAQSNNHHVIPEQKLNNNNSNSYNHKNHKTELRRRKLSLLQADVTIDLLSDNEENTSKCNDNVKDESSVNVYPERMCLERAAILGLMPVDRTKTAKPLPSIQSTKPLIPLVTTNNQQQVTNNTNIPPQFCKQQQQQPHAQPLLIQQLPLPQTQPRKRKSKPQKRRSLPVSTTKAPIELIVLSDDSNDGLAQTMLRHQQRPELSVVTCPTSSQIPCLPQPTTMQVDEEVTISLVPRSHTANNCASRLPSNLQNSTAAISSSSLAINQEIFPMLPDETTVHTVIANRIYELSLTKLREGLASCGIPEFSDGQQKISPQRRKGLIQQQPPLVSPPQAPISLKLSSDLSISLISDDDEDEARQHNHHQEPILSPAFLQKLPVNVSIAPVPMGPPTNHTAEPRKLKFG